MDWFSLRDFAQTIQTVEATGLLLLLYFLTRLSISRFQWKDAFLEPSFQIDKLEDDTATIKTVRIQGIPEVWSQLQVQKHLELAYGACTIHSLAPSGRDTHTACATITFENLPSSFTHHCSSCRSMVYDIDFEGMTPLFESNNSVDEMVDIVAVPGIKSHPLGTWQSPETAKVWLRDFIPQSLHNVRVLLYGCKFKENPDDYKIQIGSLAMALLESVKVFRSTRTTIRRPIIFIGHEMGVILIKEMLRLAAENDNLYKCTFGLLFFGDPNLDSRDSDLSEMMKTKLHERFVQGSFVGKDSETHSHLGDVLRSSAKNHPKMQIQTFYKRWENYDIQPSAEGRLEITGHKPLIVTEQSTATVGVDQLMNDFIALDKSHIGPVQFQSVQDEAFTVVENKIRKLVEHVPKAIEETVAPRFSMLQKQLLCHTVLTQNKRIRNMIGQRIAGTLVWSDNDQTIASWKTESTSCSLTITGSPGQGKSVLCNKILHDLEIGLKNMSVSSKVIYCFCSGDRPPPLQNSETILRTFILQLITESQLCDDLQQMYQTWDELNSASLQDLWSTFQILLGNTSYKQIFCIIDGLDELADSASDELLYFIQDLLTTPEPLVRHLRFKLLLSSRPEKYRLQSFETTFSISLVTSQEDLNLMIEHHADGLKNGFNESLRKYIKEQMWRKGGSSPLWINIIMKEIALISFPNEDKVEFLIKNSPSKLSELYKLLANKICEQEEPARLLAWVVYTKRAFSLREYEIALAIQPEADLKKLDDLRPFRTELTEMSIRRYAGSLLEIYQGYVYLVHKSAKDFLLSVESPLRQSGRWKNGSPELYVAESCIRFLTLQDFGSEEIMEGLNAYFSQQQTDTKTAIFMGDNTFDSDLTDRIDVIYNVNEYLRNAGEYRNISEEEFARRSFFAYASQYWYRHITSIEMATHVWGPICALLDASSAWHRSWFNWVNSFKVSKQIQTTMQEAFVATALDIGWLAAMAFLKGEGNLEASFPSSYLTYAAATGRNVIEALLPHIASRSSRASLETIIARIAVAAAKNASNGAEIIELLLMQQGVRIALTLDLVQAAAENFGCGKQVLVLVLGSQYQKFFMSQSVVDYIAENFDDSIVYMLLKHRYAVFRVTTVVIRRATRPVRTNDRLRKGWSRQGAQYVQPVISMLEAMIRKEVHEETISATSINGDEFEITPEVISAAAGHESHGEELMNSLFECRPQDVSITETVLLAAILNKASGLEVIKLLMKKRPHEVAITADVVEATILNQRFGSTILALLLNNPADDTKVDIPTFNLLLQQFNGEYVQPMLEQRQFGFQLTPMLIDRILDPCRICLKKRMMEILIERHASNIADFGRLACRMAQWNCHKGLKIMIKRQILEPSIISECLTIAWGERYPPWKTIRLLTREIGFGTTVTEAQFIRAARSFDKNAMQELFQLHPHLEANVSLINAALARISKSCARSLMLALGQSGSMNVKASGVKARLMPGTKVDRKCICPGAVSCPQTSASDDEFYRRKIVRMLLRCSGPTFPILKPGIRMLVLQQIRNRRSVELVRQLPLSGNTIRLLITDSTCKKGLLELISNEQEYEIVITKSLILAGLRWNRNGVEIMARKLLRYRVHSFRISPGAIKPLLENIKLSKKQVEGLLQLKSGALSITPRIFAHVANYTPCDETAPKALPPLEVEECVVGDLTAPLEIEEYDVNDLIALCASNVQSGERIVARLLTDCVNRGFAIPITRILKAAAGNHSKGCDVLAVVMEILEQMPEQIEIDDEGVEAITNVLPGSVFLSFDDMLDFSDELMAVLLTSRHRIRNCESLITRFIQARKKFSDSHYATMLTGMDGYTSGFGTNKESLMGGTPSFPTELELEEDVEERSQQHLKVLNCEDVITALDNILSFERRNFRKSLRRR